VRDLVLIDVGNSGVGVALWRAADPRPARWAGPERDVVPGAPEVREIHAFEATLLALPGAPSGTWTPVLASVARPARVALLVDVLTRTGLSAPVINPPSGLALALRHPETCGFDRQYAARAALRLASGPALVVDAGTALTVDAVVPRGDARGAAALADVGFTRESEAGSAATQHEGVFLGGAIAPGPRLLAEALARGGARLFEVDGLSADTPALGRDTGSALRSGVVHGFVGAALELIRAVGRDAELEDAPVWLTGGAAPLLLEALTRALGPRLVPAPDLVLTGLGSAAREVRR